VARPAGLPLDARTLLRLRGLALRLTGDPEFAEDVAQETALRALREGTPRDLPYLFRVVLNLVRTEARRVLRRRTGGYTDLDLVADPGSPEPLQRLVAEERNARVWAALGELPERERAALLLRFSEELSCDEIARVLGASPNAVSCLIHRGKEHMRTILSPGSTVR